MEASSYDANPDLHNDSMMERAFTARSAATDFITPTSHSGVSLQVLRDEGLEGLDTPEHEGDGTTSIASRAWLLFVAVFSCLGNAIANVWFSIREHFSNAMLGLEGSSSKDGPVPRNWLAPEESSLYYQRTSYSKGLLLGSSEILVTPYRVILTETECLRGPFSLPVRQRQQLLDRRLVRGYESGLVLPSCGRLFWGMFVVFFSWALLDGWLLNVPYWIMSIRVPSIRPVLMASGGPCSQLASDCASADITIAEAFGLENSKPIIDTQEPPVAQEAAAKQSRRSMLELSSNRSVSRFRNRKPWQLSVDDNSAVVSRTRNKGSQCQDFPDWQDYEGMTCHEYAQPDWVLSCLSGSGVRSNRKDVTALALSADDACCICGGGSHLSRGKAIEALEGLIRPLAIENPDVLPETSSMQIVTALLNVPNARLQEWAVDLASEPIATFITNKIKPPPSILSILERIHNISVGFMGKWSLQGGSLGKYGTFEISQHSSTGDRHPGPLVLTVGGFIAEVQLEGEDLARGEADLADIGTVTIELQKDKPNEVLIYLKTDSEVKRMTASRFLFASAKKEAATSGGQSWTMTARAYVVTGALAIRCLFRIIAILGITHGVLIILGWIAYRFFTSRIYVTLKVHKDYFGPGTAPELWQKRLGEHDISNIYGFYLPDATWAPGCLPALAMALLDQNSNTALSQPRMPSLVGV